MTKVLSGIRLLPAAEVSDRLAERKRQADSVRGISHHARTTRRPSISRTLGLPLTAGRQRSARPGTRGCPLYRRPT